MIAIVDYGVNNLRSVQKALERVGAEALVTGDPDTIRSAPGVLLPGVGAFGDAMEVLRRTGLAGVVRDVFEEGTPLLGICLGMQLLFEESEEMGRHRGLGLLAGTVKRFDASLKVPHVGWNEIHPHKSDGILCGIHEGDYGYFVHSYYVVPEEPSLTAASTDYGIEFPSVIQSGRVAGIQFHPEKSQDVGLQILRNFAEAVKTR